MGDILLNSKVVVNRNFPKNFKAKDLKLFAHEIKVSIDIPSPLTLKNIIINSNGIGYHIFALKPCTMPQVNLVQNYRSYHVLLKDLLKVCFDIKSKTIKKACWVTDDWSGNYFHWFTEVIPKLIYLENKCQDCIVLLPQKLFALDFVTTTIAEFKLSFVPVTNFDKLFIRYCLAIPNFAPSGNFLPGLISLTRKKFLRFETKGSRRIFVKRKFPLTRRVLNEVEILDVLKKYSFECIDLEGVTLERQIKLFSETDLLVGVHGAALTNMLFMPRGAKILEFRREDDYKNNCYFSMASVLKLDYFYQLCEVDDRNVNTQQNDFYICPITLEKNLTILIGNV